jgi:YD repeat-containing protein
VEHVRTLFFDDDATGPHAATRFLKASLALGDLGKRGLIYERYTLALTDSLLDAVFTDGQIDEIVHGGQDVRTRLRHPGSSGYVNGERFFENPPPAASHEYWMRSGVGGFAASADQHFFLPEEFTDAFGNTTSVEYDGKYDLFIRASTDMLGNTTTVEQFDYRVLTPIEQRDANANYSAVALDIFGLAVATAVMGKQRAESGDSLTGLVTEVQPSDVAAFFGAPYSENRPKQWLADATTRSIYDFGDDVDANGDRVYMRRPPATCGIARTTHVSAGSDSDIQVSVEYSDGHGAVLVRKAQAEPDPQSGDDVTLRWIASGKTVLNNKGKPVKQYEPYFSRTEHRFDETEATTEVGVTPLMYYDSAGRLVRTESPDGSYSRVEFSPWHVRSFDANDTVNEPANPWYAANTAANATPEQRRAASLALVHHNTPSLMVLDSLGRQVIAIAQNRVADAGGTYEAGGKKYRDEYYLTYTKLDAEGKALWTRDALGNSSCNTSGPRSRTGTCPG